MMETRKDIPCINCIVYTICRNRIKEFASGWEVTNMTEECDLLKGYVGTKLHKVNEVRELFGLRNLVDI